MLRVAFHCDFQLMPHIMIVLVRNAYRESRLQLEDVYFYPFQELEIQKSAFLNSLLVGIQLVKTSMKRENPPIKRLANVWLF